MHLLFVRALIYQQPHGVSVCLQGKLGPRLAGPLGAAEWGHVMARVAALGRPDLDLRLESPLQLSDS